MIGDQIETTIMASKLRIGSPLLGLSQFELILYSFLTFSGHFSASNIPAQPVVLCEYYPVGSTHFQ